MESCGKNCARATPICALAAIECCLRLLNIRPPFEQLRWQASRQDPAAAAASAFGSLCATGPGICPSRSRDRIFLLLNVLFDLWNLARSPCTAVAPPAAHPTAAPTRRSPASWSGRPIPARVFSVSFAISSCGSSARKCEIGGRHLLHQRQPDRALRPGLRQQLRARRFGLPAVKPQKSGVHAAERLNDPIDQRAAKFDCPAKIGSVAPIPVPPTLTVGNCCERVILTCACCSRMRCAAMRRS